MKRQLESGEPVCFRIFDDAREWLEEQNRYRLLLSRIRIPLHLR